MTSNDNHPASERLDGWKEIAAYLKRSVRTVQRWEALLRLPVHRLNTGQAESVYAIPAELDAWLASPPGRRGAEEAAHATWTGAVSRHRLWVAASAAAGVLAMLAAAGWMAGAFPRAPGGQPSRSAGKATRHVASLAVDGNALLLLDNKGVELGRHVFSSALKELVDPARLARYTAIADVDGDGASEVVVARTVIADHLGLVLEADGSERSRFSVPRAPRFGGASNPWTVMVPGLVHVPDPPDGTFFVAANVQDDFGSVLMHLDAAGRLLHQYWSNGYIESMAQVRTGTGVRTFVGAIHNESKGASLAVFDGPPSGAAPARTAYFSCVDCQPGGPAAYFVFPQSRIQRRLNCMAAVTSISARSSGAVVQVQLGDTGTYGARPEDTEYAYYHLSPNLDIVRTNLGDRLLTVIDRLIAERRSGLTSADRYHGEADLFPVERLTPGKSGWIQIGAPAASTARNAPSGTR